MRIIQSSSARVLFALLIPVLAACGFAATSAAQGRGGQPAAGGPPAAPAPLRVFITGGGTSHDYNRWFRTADSTIFATIGARATYADSTKDMLAPLATMDALYMTVNHSLSQEVRDGIMAAANRGVGIIVGHAGAWYNNWGGDRAPGEGPAIYWPEYHHQILAGGARAHPRIHAFGVTVVAPNHPVMRGVPATFSIEDELYQVALEPGANVTVLATATHVATGITYPVIYVVNHPNARILVNTIGHAETHDRPEYKQILTNGLLWVTHRIN